MRLLRATAASIASYLFFNRGECSACVLVDDLVINNTHITLLLRHEKGQQTLNEGERNARQVLSSEAPRNAAMLGTFFTSAGTMGPRSRHRALAPVEETELWTTNTLSGWLTTAYTSALCLPRVGFAWTSHSPRKGAASAAYAIGARLTDIRYAGGWSTNSTVLEAKCIDFTMRPSPAAWIFFGYLYRGTPRGDC